MTHLTPVLAAIYYALKIYLVAREITSNRHL
jgi:hypothetical protein